MDDRSEGMGYKIREAFQEHKIPYVLVIGDKEMEDGQLSLRIRGIGEAGKVDIENFIDKVSKNVRTKSQKLDLE